MISPRQLLLRFFLCTALGLTLANCGGVSYYESFNHYQQDTDGVYHPVQKGQTLYSTNRAWLLVDFYGIFCLDSDVEVEL